MPIDTATYLSFVEFLFVWFEAFKMCIAPGINGIIPKNKLLIAGQQIYLCIRMIELVVSNLSTENCQNDTYGHPVQNFDPHCSRELWEPGREFAVDMKIDLAIGK